MSTNCLVGSAFDNSVASTVTHFEYWYGVETSTDDIESFRYDLEGAIYHEALKSVVWCTDTGNRRIQETDGTMHYVDNDGRRLAIMAISSAPIDEPQLDYTCTQTLKTEGDSCFMIKGLMSIMHPDGDSVSSSVSYLREGIKNAMESDVLLGSSSHGRGDLSVITRVTYLGDTDPTLKEDDPFVPPTVSDGIKSVSATDNRDQGNDNFAPIMAASFFGAACVMLLGIFVAKRRRRTSPTGPIEVKAPGVDIDEDTFGDDTIVSLHGDDNVFTSPPPPSEDDLRAQALEAERQYAAEKGLGTIPEDRTYYSEQQSSSIEMMIPADASHLGSCHSTMDVQPCQSPSCNQCQNESVVFISKDWQPDMTPRESDDDDSSMMSSSRAIM